MSISTLTKSFFLSSDKLVSLKVWGMIHVWNPFLVFFDIVSDIPFIDIEAFSTKFTFSFELTMKSNK